MYKRDEIVEMYGPNRELTAETLKVIRIALGDNLKKFYKRHYEKKRQN